MLNLKEKKKKTEKSLQAYNMNKEHSECNIFWNFIHKMA